MSAPESAQRERRLRALDVAPLRLRAQPPATRDVAASVAATMTPEPAAPAASMPSMRIARLALHLDPAELADPAVNRMYMALTEAVGKVGLQAVRVCDVADDSSAAVLVFGAAPLPEDIPAVRVLRTDPLSVLHADRERKRLLWERLQALGRSGD